MWPWTAKPLRTLPFSCIALVYPYYVCVLQSPVQNENRRPLVQKAEKSFFLSSRVSFSQLMMVHLICCLMSHSLGHGDIVKVSANLQRHLTLWLSKQVYVLRFDPSCIHTQAPPVEAEGLSREVGRDRRSDHTWATAPSPQCMLYCLIRLHLQDTCSKLKSLRISKWHLQSIKLKYGPVFWVWALCGYTGNVSMKPALSLI